MPTDELTTWETEPLLEGYDPERKESEFKIAPAKWIWLPSQRTLPCTFVLFRKEFDLEKVPRSARGWIAADSRYILYVNGIRIQFGPAPHDPRHAEADPIDIRGYLKKGRNVIAVHVLFYGHGDGTWPIGKPGLLFRLNVGKEVIASDETWKCSVDRGHKPGGAKRWYLRALQEDFDSRLFSHGWNEVEYRLKHYFHTADETPLDCYWYNAQVLDNSSASSAFASPYQSYADDIRMENPGRSTLTGRSIPMMQEEICATVLTTIDEIIWTGNPNDWFDFRVPGIYTTKQIEPPLRLTEGSYLLTYKLPFGMVGWPIVTVLDAAQGVVEVMCQESIDPNHPLMDTHFYAWTRFKLSSRQTEYECFDYECCKYIQVHLDIPRGYSLPVPNVRFRRRTLLKLDDQMVSTSETSLNALLLASTITLQNSAQDIVVDGMARERQQYAGDGAHQLHAVRQAHGCTSLSRRFLTQFGYGQMLNGVWFDSWPAYDRFARLGQRQIGATGWGSLVDHSIGFVIEHVHHWLQTGDRGPYELHKKQIEKFIDYLQTITGLDGLLRVDDIGSEAVWMDHDSYHDQAHKKLALNLYALQMVVMLDWIEGRQTDLTFPLEAIRKHFHHDKLGVLINNRDEVATRAARYCDRAISHLLWLHAHGHKVVPDLAKTIDILVKQPKSMGVGYPANSVWRHWAWARIGRVDLILKEFREKWAKMYSVKHNQTIQEMWNVKPGTTALMSHCAVSPTIMMHQAILGIGQDAGGNWFIRPQLGDLETFEIKSHTPFGAIIFKAKQEGDIHKCEVMKPKEMGLSLRTIGPVDIEMESLELAFHDRGTEFSTDLTGIDFLAFNISPYPENKLISDVELG